MENLDLVVVGAGWFGLVAAKTYVELHPFDNVVILEAADSVGGVWAEHRLYPGLKSNNMVGTYEYPDFPMRDDVYGVKAGEHPPGPIIHRYLTDYAKQFGIYEKIRFGTKVNTAAPNQEGGWILETSQTGRSALSASRLIMATGLTSQPYIPRIPGLENFQATFFHPKDFRSHEETVKSAQNAVVLGGAKSAFDVAYAYASAGAHVDMIVRKSGHGPVWLAPPFVTPLKKWLEKLLHTRFLTWMSPCVWGDEDGYAGTRSFLHGNPIGRLIVKGFWKVLGSDVIALNKYDSHPELQKLKPWDSAFFVGSELGIHNYPTSFWDLVRKGQIHVHIDELQKLEGKNVYLASGIVLPTDVFVSATGWTKEPAIDFLNGTEDKIGLHHSLTGLEPLIKEADTSILSRFPRLRDQPERKAQLEKTIAERSSSTLRFYNFMVPPAMIAERNLAFSGMCTTATTAIVATVQALWISAFFDGKLDRLPESDKEIMWKTVLHSQYVKWRHPTGYGVRYPDFVFDALPYLDMLLKDLGLKSHRKQGAIAEISSPYGPEDYIGLVDEWKTTHLESKKAQ